MDEGKSREELTILEAVDNLSAMADLDVQGAAQEVPPEEEAALEAEEKYKRLQLLNPKHTEENREVIKQTFRVIRNYLQHVYEKEQSDLEDPETQKGINAIMVLAGEAAQKVGKFTSIFKGTHEKEATGLKEFQELQQFYMSKIMKKFQQSLESEEAWQAEWGEVEEDFLDIQRRGLKDLETVRRDKEYDLFYIQKEDGRPFFNRNLLRHIKLVGDFDELISDPTGEDPFLRVKIIQDRGVHQFAKEIMRSLIPYLDEFFKDAMRHKEKPLVSTLNKAIMGLMLAANPRNLMQNTIGKCALNYYMDFQIYLRMALSSEEYRKLLAFPPPEEDHFWHSLLRLIHAICGQFFVRLENRREEIELVHRLIRRGQQKKRSAEIHGSAISIWNNLLDEDDQIRNLLKYYPNGPLFKTLDAFREGSEKIGFDPILQNNMPSQLFSVAMEDLHLSCLKIPSPTHQEFINRATVIPEFSGFIRSLKSRGQKHLLINLQDRTSWHEHSRCIALEELQNQEPYTKFITVITLPKNTDFYFQNEDYQHLNQADLFLEQFKEQIASGEECGFYFPPKIKKETITEFTKKALKMIHQVFFAQKDVLTRKNRLDFIEIFYLFLTMHFILEEKPDTISFTCKDAIDTGAAQNAAFFAFSRMLSSDQPWTADEKDFLTWLLFCSALIVRERCIDAQRLHRTISSLALMNAELETKRHAIMEQIHALYGARIFKKMKVEK